MKKIFFLVFLLMFVFLQSYELDQLIQSPTAGILQKGEASIKMELYKNDGIILGARVGLFPGFMFGVSYGAEGVVGNQKPNWHSRVEFMAKYRIFDETKSVPAIALGFSSEGHGVYYKELKRYDIKSKGFYAVASKNWMFLGNLGTHLGTNFTLENLDSKNMDFFVGLDKTIGDRITLLCEYDFAINDRKDSLHTASQDISLQKIGYLNSAILIDFSNGLSAKLSFYDLLKNRNDTTFADRTLMLIYTMKF